MTENQSRIHNRCLYHKLSVAQTAYVMATVQHETNGLYRPVKEAYWLSESWRKDHLRYYPWYGRGFVQLTWRENYSKAARYFNRPDILTNPDVLLTDVILSLDILIVGMMQGWFGKPLTTFINKSKKEYRNARRSVNGIDKAALIASYAEDWELLIQGYPIIITPPKLPQNPPSSYENAIGVIIFVIILIAIIFFGVIK